MAIIERAEPKPSDILLGLVEEIKLHLQSANHHFESAKEFVIKAYNQALSEGFTPQGARKFLYENIAYSDRTIRKYLPDEAKDLSKVRYPVLSQSLSDSDFAEALPQTLKNKSLENYNFLKEAAETNPEKYGRYWRLLNNTNAFAMLVNRMHRKAIRVARIEEAKKQALARIPPANRSKKFELICDDFREVAKDKSKIPDNSINAVFVDPLYPEEYLYLTKPLGQFSYDVLIPGSSLFIIAPNPAKSYLYYLNTMLNCGFEWVHYLPIVHEGDIARLHAPGIRIMQKPLLWFYKPDADGNMTPIYKDVDNIIFSKEPDKDEKEAFELLQSPEEVKHVLEVVTVPGMRVLDPMMGEGTTGIGALELGLYFTGIEINRETCDKANYKLSKFS